MGDRVRTLRKYARGVFLVLGLAACGRTSGCSGCDQEGEPFPDKDRVHSAVQVRLTEPGLTFLEENLEPLLAEAIPDGLNICVPGQGGDVAGLVQWGFCQQACGGDGEMGCPVNIGIGAVDLSALEPATLRAVVNFQELSADFDVAADPIVSCSVSIRGPGFPVSVDLELSTPEPTRNLTFRVANPRYRLADLDIQLQGNDGFLSPLCDVIDGVINFPIIGDVVFDLLQGFIDGQLTGLIAGFVDDFTCRKCDEGNACPINQGAQCVDGTCMIGDTCVAAPLGLEGALDLGDLLGGFSPGLEAKIGYLATPGSYVQVENSGLSLGVISGAVSPHNRCVPVRAQPENVEPPRADALRFNEAPGGAPFEVGIGISDVIVRHFLWAAFNSGTLCLALTTDTIEQLSVATLGIALPNLRSLARGDAPIAITLSPQEVPVATFGRNIVVDDPDDPGQRVLQEPLLTLEIPNLWLDFHLFMEDRWVRIFSLSADVSVPVGVDFTPDNKIVPMLGDLGTALRNVRGHNGEIMRDDPSRLAALLPVLLRPLTSLVADGLLSPIELPDVMGYSIDMQAGSVTSIQDNAFLAVFANLERVPGEDGMGAAFSVETAVELRGVHVPPTEEFSSGAPDAWRKPFVKVAVDAWDGTDEDADMEFSWRVDQGTWSLFTAHREMEIRDPVLLLQGRHRLEVRARRIDDYRSLDLTPAELEFLIDSVAPEVTLSDSAEGAVRVAVADIVSPVEAIRLDFRLDGGEWQVLDGDVIEAPEAARVEVRAVDEAGNVGEGVLARDESALIGRLPPDQRDGGGGCGGCATSGGGADPFAVLCLLGGFLLLRRRRLGPHGGAGLLLLLVGLVPPACSDDSKSSGDDDQVDAGPPDGGPNPGECKSNEECEANETCRDGECVLLPCMGDESCAGMQCDGDARPLCNNMGVCQCEPFCGDGCGEGQYCCLSANECRNVPQACAGTQCDPGFEIVVTSAGQVNTTTCQVEGVECGCVEKMPLDPGFIGRHSDMTVAGGVAWFSAYAEKYGDLVVGRRERDGAFTWWWVDGLPEDGAIEGGPSGPRGGVAAPGDDVGLYTAIGRGPEGEVHVAYYDNTHKALRYALGVPSGDAYDWTIRTLDATGDAGRWASLSVNARGVPGIAYRVARNRAAEGWVSEVRYVLARNARPAGDADWNAPFTLQQTPREEPCGGLCGMGEACVAETGTCGRITRGMCDAECGEGQACVEGACQAVAALPDPPRTYPEGTGLFTSQTRDLEGNPVVAWYDRTRGALWLSRFVDAGFAEPEMHAGWGHADEDRDGDMGTNVDVAVDADGEIHLCYQDGMTDSLRYLAPGLDRDEWVDDGVRRQAGPREYEVHVVGEDCNMRLDANGDPVLVYQDATSHDILLARRDSEGNWIRSTLRGEEPAFEGSFGFYTRAHVDGGKLWVSSYFYDNRHMPFPQGIDVFSVDLP